MSNNAIRLAILFELHQKNFAIFKHCVLLVHLVVLRQLGFGKLKARHLASTTFAHAQTFDHCVVRRLNRRR